MSIKKNIELDKGAENMSVEDEVIDTPSNHDEYEANRLKIFKKRALRDLHSYFGENPKECLSAEGLYYEKTNTWIMVRNPIITFIALLKHFVIPV